MTKIWKQAIEINNYLPVNTTEQNRKQQTFVICKLKFIIPAILNNYNLGKKLQSMTKITIYDKNYNI